MTNLTQRLLCAARQAYEIGPGGAVSAYDAAHPRPPHPPMPPPAQVSETACIAYQVAPVGFLADTSDVDAAFAAVIPEGILISVRGTFPPDRFAEAPDRVILDWAYNTRAMLTSTATHSIVFPGKVHSGYYNSFRALWDGPAGLFAKVMALLQQHPAKTRVLITGHSKGGAICPLIAWRLHEVFAATPALANHTITVRAFAPARIGDQAFADAYNPLIQDHIRYEYDDDIVPHLPIRTKLLEDAGLAPAAADAISAADPGYGDVGKLRYIDDHGRYVDMSVADRVKQIAQRLAFPQIITPFGLSFVLGCHDIARGSGYARALYNGPEDA